MMAPFERVLHFILAIQLWDVVKLVVFFILLLYIAFALLVVRQVELMARTLIVPIAPSVKILARIHFALAVFAFLLALVVL